MGFPAMVTKPWLSNYIAYVFIFVRACVRACVVFGIIENALHFSSIYSRPGVVAQTQELVNSSIPKLGKQRALLTPPLKTRSFRRGGVVGVSVCLFRL